MSTLRIQILAPAAALLLAASSIGAPTTAPAPITFESLLRGMIDRGALARFPEPDFRLRQASSYNRASKTPDDPEGWFTNHDFNASDKDRNFVRIEENQRRKEWVLMADRGPGVIVRCWMPWRKPTAPQTTAILRIYLDGSETPVIEGNALELFQSRGLIPYPFAHGSLRSAVSFFPIPYARSCKVTFSERPFFFQFTYRSYPPGTPVKTFTMEDFEKAAGLTQRVGKALLNPELSHVGKTVALSDTMGVNEEKSLHLPAGAAAVRHLAVKLGNCDNPAVTRSVVLKMTFDGRQTVWCPVGDFFGSGLGLHPFQGWYRTVAEDGTMSCRWVMPYRHSGTISLVNLGDRPVAFQLEASVADWQWDDRSLYFNAAWRGQYPVPTRPHSDWNYVTLKGRGVYVGDTLTVMNPIEKWWGEGDEKIWVDGEAFPSMFGTGTEDYYGYSWGGRSTDFYEHPFHAQVRCNQYDKLHRKTGDERNTQGYSTETRTRALDTIPFGRSLQLDMEVWSGTDCDMGYGVGVYWYGDAATTSNRRPDPEGARSIPLLPVDGESAAAPEQSQPPVAATARTTPNVVLILVDDLGYGDVGCYGATKVKTPNIDRLAAEGRRFTDAHSASAVCTPSRHALLTGEYPLRANGGRGVWGPAPVTSGLIIDPNRFTLADLFKSKGYATAVLGKWHLGFKTGKNDWREPLRPGPQDLGFDYYYGIPVVSSAPPYVWVENDHVVGGDPADPLVYVGRRHANEVTPITPIPPEASQRTPNMFKGAIEAHKRFNPYEVGAVLAEKAVDWITANASTGSAQGKQKPFFLYLATPQIHHPFTPGKRFQGSSQCGLYGDFIQELDWMVGQVMQCLDDNGLTDDTLVIFTSDNGGMFNIGAQAAFRAGHRINGDLLGFKFGVWEGGQRVPFIARWPGKIKAGTRSDQLICLVDMLATFAALTGQKLRPAQLGDSVNVLPALTGEPASPLRDPLVLAPFRASLLSVRQGKWMYIPAQGSGGWTSSKPGTHTFAGPAAATFTGHPNSDIVNGHIKKDAPPAQLYDLEKDVNETTNLYNQYPEVAREMDALLKMYKPSDPTRSRTKSGRKN